MRFVLAAVIALAASILPAPAVASTLTPDEQQELDAYIGRLKDLGKEMDRLNEELKKPGVPIEKPNREMCYGLLSVATDLVEDKLLPAEEFPSIALKREKARVVMRAQWAKEGLDEEGMDLQLIGRKLYYEEEILDDSGKMKVVNGWVDTRVKYCEKLF